MLVIDETTDDEIEIAQLSKPLNSYNKLNTKQSKGIIERVLGDYCPIYFRRYKYINYDSDIFEKFQKELVKKEIIIISSNNNNVNLLDKLFYLILPKCILNIIDNQQLILDEDTLDEIIEKAIKEGDKIQYKGIKLVERRHFFRRWLNHIQDMNIIRDYYYKEWYKKRKYKEHISNKEAIEDFVFEQCNPNDIISQKYWEDKIDINDKRDKYKIIEEKKEISNIYITKLFQKKPETYEIVDNLIKEMKRKKKVLKDFNF